MCVDFPWNFHVVIQLGLQTLQNKIHCFWWKTMTEYCQLMYACWPVGMAYKLIFYLLNTSQEVCPKFLIFEQKQKGQMRQSNG